MTTLLLTFAMLADAHLSQGCDLSPDLRDVGREILAHLSGANTWIGGDGPDAVREALGVNGNLGFPRDLEREIEGYLASL